MINVTDCGGDRGRFDKLMEPGRKRKPWEVGGSYNMQNLSLLEREKVKKDKIIQQ